MPFATMGQAIPAPEPGSFLAMLTAADHQDLIARGSVEHWAPGETLFREGDDGALVLVLLSGRVQVRSVADGDQSITLGPGSLLGELSAISGKPRSATVLALEAARSLALAPEEYLAVLEKDSRIANALLRRYIERCHMVERMRS